jgi:serine/threonine-protein kinase
MLPKPPRDAAKNASPSLKDGEDHSIASAATAAAGPQGTPAARRNAAHKAEATALIGQTLSGRYRIDRLLGEGGMGAVYEAEHTHMRKRLAVKVLHQEMSRLPEVVARFEREAMAAAHIDHPNVAAATDFGMLEDGSFFLALEYVEGHSLRDVVSHGRLELGRALHVVSQMAQALHRAHALGIVHRDLKPENVMLVEREGDPDFVKVLDFGIAKVPVGELASEEPAASAASGAPKILTQLGMVYGTPEYMAPEQALGQSIDARADLYAVGVMLYEMLSGTRPFDHESKVALLGMHVTARVPPFAERAPEALVPPEVEAIVMRLMKKESSERFADARELFEAVTAVELLLIERRRIEPRGIISVLGGAPSTSAPNFALPSGPRLGSPATASPSLVRASFGSTPARVGEESGGIRVGIPPSNVGRYATLAAAFLAIVSLVVLGAVVAGRAHLRTAGSVGADGGSVAGGALDRPDGVDNGNDDRIAAALASIDKGDYGTGIATLTTLEPQEMARADVHRALLKAYLATGASSDAMREVGLLVKADASATNDPKVLEDVRNAAIGKGDAADEAFALLESSLGTVGIDELYDIAYAQWASEYPAASARAQKALASAEVRARGTPAVQVTLDLRSASSCDRKHALLARAAELGNSRTLAVLKAYVPARGCGFLGARDCWPCLHKDGSLAKTISAIEERTPKK